MWGQQSFQQSRLWIQRIRCPLCPVCPGSGTHCPWDCHDSLDCNTQRCSLRTVDPEAYNVPSYEEVVGSGNYPVRQSNLRQSTSQLPSYEDIIRAVENEGSQPTRNSTQNSPVDDQTPAAAQPTAEPSSLTSQHGLPTRSASRASRLLKPLRVRRIKSDKLHLKDFRLQIRTPTQNPVTIEPITPPPQYENKMPELQ
ncbi:hypothetical protein CRENBAI_008264 [Crenichthys baileyi]|uniref:Uncharacterized protein n=1 Tax=Crenichthys baileyi TaxID=28760 RepID=A0AAV9RUH7_9TELE